MKTGLPNRALTRTAPRLALLAALALLPAAAAAQSVAARVAVGQAPHGVDVSPDGGRIYVTNLDGQSVSIIDAASLEVIGAVAVERGPVNIVLSPDGTRAYVANEFGGSISVIDTFEQKVVGRVETDRRPHGLALSPDGKRLYVCNIGSDTLLAVDTATLQVTGRVSVGDAPDTPIVSADGRSVWVTNYGRDGGQGTVSLVDAQSLTELAVIPMGVNPHALSLSLNGKFLYVTVEQGNEVVIVRTNSRDVKSRRRTGRIPHGMRLSPDGKTLWTVDIGSRTATLLKSKNGKRVAQVSLGDTAAPHAIAFSPDGRRAYVTDLASNELIVLDIP
jgi:YVTN family beta-propeller protein